MFRGHRDVKCSTDIRDARARGHSRTEHSCVDLQHSCREPGQAKGVYSLSIRVRVRRPETGGWPELAC